MNSRAHDRSGNLRPLRERKPVVYWTALLVVGAMIATGFAALVSLL